MRLRSSGSPPSGASCLVALACLVLFAFAGRVAASDPAKGDNISWTFDKRIADLERRVAALEGGVNLFEAKGPFELGTTPLTVPLTPVRATAAATTTVAAAGHRAVFDGVPHVCGGDGVYRPDGGPTAGGYHPPPPPVYANFRPAVMQNFTPVRFVGAGCANGTCR